MGVKVIESEDMFSDEECCSSCCSNKTKTNDGENKENTTTTTPTPSSSSYKEIIGNCKEIRIENNFNNLRIIGNNNRIRINLNMADLVIVGNNTRLKIRQNHADIKYNGNNGRISLGNATPPEKQFVEYVGCNGTLKIVNTLKLQSSCKTKNSNETTKQATNPKACNDKKQSQPKSYCIVKSHSEGGFSSDKNLPHFNKFYNNCKSNTSMPNLNNCKAPYNNYKKLNHKQDNIAQQPKSIIQNFGDIIITNSSNISISPHTTYTTNSSSITTA